ncbi:hypothetical protein MYSTI_02152 [Myxococcus stipitatus DSM 14675]|uniref:Uncharacterized protein n=1 Tax=Myxococcus stipitatus (strain DSM 14675 / JCM 12634 / Mx s8) TaxID=1278073 RepID=L7UAL5_MYXSD|nr:hypothetical protein MYSTI_02152 [Myxococcus stipitatus DSM 14675]
MFTAEELEALVLGSRWGEAQPDAGLAGAARNALGKLATASPDDLRDRMKDTGLWPILMRGVSASVPVLGLVRRAGGHPRGKARPDTKASMSPRSRSARVALAFELSGRRTARKS